MAAWKPLDDLVTTLGKAGARFHSLHVRNLVDDVHSVTVEELETTFDAAHTHANKSALDAYDATAFALLAGRAGGQTLIGGTAASETLALRSTAHSTKGAIDLGATLRILETSGRVGIGPTLFDASADFEIRGNTAGVTSGDLLVDTANRQVTIGRLSGTAQDGTRLVARNRVGTVVLNLNLGLQSDPVSFAAISQGGGVRISADSTTSVTGATAANAMLDVDAPVAQAGTGNVATSGSSTTVTSSAAFSRVRVGTLITANGVSRTVTAVASTSSLTVDTAVDWSAGYSWTYTNPVARFAQGGTTLARLLQNGYLGLGITNGVHPARLSLVAGTTAVDGLAFGTDTNLYRAGADSLKTDDLLTAVLGINTPKITNLTDNGLVLTGSGDGTLSVLAAGGGTSKFLREDLTFQEPPAGGAGALRNSEYDYTLSQQQGLTHRTWSGVYDPTPQEPRHASYCGENQLAVVLDNGSIVLLDTTDGSAVWGSPISPSDAGYAFTEVLGIGGGFAWAIATKAASPAKFYKIDLADGSEEDEVTATATHVVARGLRVGGGMLFATVGADTSNMLLARIPLASPAYNSHDIDTTYYSASNALVAGVIGAHVYVSFASALTTFVSKLLAADGSAVSMNNTIAAYNEAPNAAVVSNRYIHLSLSGPSVVSKVSPTTLAEVASVSTGALTLLYDGLRVASYGASGLFYINEDENALTSWMGEGAFQPYTTDGARLYGYEGGTLGHRPLQR